VLAYRSSGCRAPPHSMIQEAASNASARHALLDILTLARNVLSRIELRAMDIKPDLFADYERQLVEAAWPILSLAPTTCSNRI
jgi:hypothetical protein